MTNGLPPNDPLYWVDTTVDAGGALMMRVECPLVNTRTAIRPVTVFPPMLPVNVRGGRTIFAASPVGGTQVNVAVPLPVEMAADASSKMTISAATRTITTTAPMMAMMRDRW
jgi:hypothetical protein